MDQNSIRNFAIIAHIDHGKSTLADRFLELTGTVSQRDMVAQTLDSHPISRERGITIRLAPVTMNYELRTTNYTLNLIDTPGHVDFSYEVERTLAACEGAILLVDATQGIQAQTLSHLAKAQKLGLKIIPAINKIDMDIANVEETEKELRELLRAGDSEAGPKVRDIAASAVVSSKDSFTNSTGYASLRSSTFGIAELAGPAHGENLQIHKISAKTGQGVKELLEAVISEVPPPAGNPTSSARALIFSSQYDPRRGVIAFIRLVDGQISASDKIQLLATKATGNILEIGHFTPEMTSGSRLETGEVGYLVTNIKEPSLLRVGDTLTTVRSSEFIVRSKKSPTDSELPTTNYQLPTTNYPFVPLPGYLDPQPMVFVSLFPVDQNDFAALEDALRKLKLNDAAISFQPTGSKALGRGFRCGFLGHLHAEISQERLEEDFNLSILATTPTVEYRSTTDSKLPTTNYEEPWVKATIIVPQNYLGNLLSLCDDRRGHLQNMEYHGLNVTLTYDLPLSEIITDFFDQMKSVSSGYASMDYELTDFRPFDAVTLNILINHEEIDAFSLMMEKSRAEKYGKFLVERLKDVIPRQQIPVPIQASIDNQIIARADIPAFRKDVAAKLYGGDFTRRLKLVEKQKKGKRKMLALSRVEGKQIGKVSIPSDTFLKIFRT